MTDTALGWIVVVGFALLAGAVVYLWQESRDQAQAYNLTQERVAKELEGHDKRAEALQSQVDRYGTLLAQQETRLRILEEGVSLAAPEPEKTVSRARGSWRDIAARAEAGSDKNGALDELRK